jgi:predicted flap endonuclease-1-like 5' DNA nuclease
VNGLSLLALIAAAIAIVVAYRLGRIRARREPPVAFVPRVQQEPAQPAREEDTRVSAEKFRLIVAYEAEAARLRAELAAREARVAQLSEFAEDRRALFGEIAEARTQLARFREIVVDIENNAPPPILGERGTPDDLKLIVGIGPVLERMLQQLGIATYRQIARWSEHDIDAMDARLPEFPGRIRRDAWVTQARALHQSKYGERA